VFAYPLWSAAGCLFAILLYIPLHRRRFRRLPKAADILLLAGTGFYGLVAMAAFGPLASPDE
jgi:drug/metabolite transporter (DMT)-like permease